MDRKMLKRLTSRPFVATTVDSAPRPIVDGLRRFCAVGGGVYRVALVHRREMPELLAYANAGDTEAALLAGTALEFVDKLKSVKRQLCATCSAPLGPPKYPARRVCRIARVRAWRQRAFPLWRRLPQVLRQA
jgi:hypothetical protein